MRSDSSFKVILDFAFSTDINIVNTIIHALNLYYSKYGAQM